MKFLVCTYFTGGNSDNVRALGNSIRIFSQMESLCVISRDVGDEERKFISGHFSKVDVADFPLSYILGLDQYDKILLLSPNFLMVSKIDSLLLGDMGGSPKMNVAVVKPSRLIAEISNLVTVEEIRSFFLDRRYEWRSLSPDFDSIPSSNTRSLILRGSYLSHPKKKDLIARLSYLMYDILGDEGREAVEKEESTYVLAFTHKSVNPVSNYDVLEAYGDGFLKGSYMWILESTPGIISADQITKTADHYGGREILAEIAETLGLVQYINIDRSKGTDKKAKPVKLDVKVKSDIIESLIGAIAFSHERLYGKGAGDRAVNTFVSKIYEGYTIDVQGYAKAYTSPIQLINLEMLGKRLNTKLLTNETSTINGNVVHKLLYNGQIIGVGIVPRSPNDKEVSEDLAKKQAYRDAVDKKSLDKFVIN
jgi:dsRNA-specific ribonuclease